MQFPECPSSSSDIGIDYEKIASLKKLAESILVYCEDLTQIVKIKDDYLNLKKDAIEKTQREITRFTEKGNFFKTLSGSALIEGECIRRSNLKRNVYLKLNSFLF